MKEIILLTSKYIKKTKYIPHIVTFAMIILMSEVISFTCLRELYSGLFFSLFQIFGIVIPGTTVLLLAGWKKKLDWQACAFSFVIGYIVSLLMYFILMLLGLRVYILYIVLILAVVCCAYLYYRLRKDNTLSNYNHCSSSKDQKIILVFTGVMFLITLFSSCFFDLVQPTVYDSSPENDMMFWVGNIIELTKEFPPKDFTQYPMAFSYHYFSSAQLALASMCTKIRPLYIGLFFSVVQSVLLRVFSGYLLFTKCAKSHKMLMLCMIIMFFSSGYESKVIIMYFSHLYVAPLGVEYGLSIFLMFLYLLIIKKEEVTNKIKTSILIWLCIFILAGTKISYGGIALLGLGILCFAFLIKKQFKKAFITGIPALGIFIVEYFYMINLSRFINNPNSGYNGSSFVPIWTTRLPWLYDHIDLFTSIINLPAEPFCIMYFSLLASPVCFCIVLHNIYKLTKEKKWDALDVTFLSMYIAGLMVMIFVQMNGMSNMYFAFVSFPVAITWFIRTGLYDSNIAKNIIKIAATLSVIGFLFGNSWALAVHAGHGGILLMNNCVPDRRHNESAYVSHEEYEAYEWIRNNSSENCMIATNRLKSRAVGAFTERYVNNPNFKNSIFTQATDEDRATVLTDYRNKGVEFIVYEVDHGARLAFLDNTCDIAWENNSIVIYSVP